MDGDNAGANSFGYFCHSFATGSSSSIAVLNDTAMVHFLTPMNQRIESLASVLNSSTVNNLATVNTTNIRRMVKQQNGKQYIFAVSMQSASTSATFTVTNPPSSTVTVLDENRTLTISGGQFSEYVQFLRSASVSDWQRRGWTSTGQQARRNSQP